MILLAAALTCDDAGGREGLLALFGRSSLTGMHSHPVGQDGYQIAALERAHERRRTRTARRLAAVCGTEPVRRVDDEAVEAANEVHRVSGPSETEEYTNLYRARRALRDLDGRLKREGTR